MESFEAMRRMVRGDAVPLAKRIGRSSSLIQKWCEPSTDFSDSGAYNPLDRLEGMIEEALRRGRVTTDALAPLYYLAERFDCLVLPCPPPACGLAELQQQVCLTVQEAGEFFAEVAKDMADGKITPNELKQIGQRGHDLVAAVTLLERMAKEAAGR